MPRANAAPRRHRANQRPYQAHQPPLLRPPAFRTYDLPALQHNPLNLDRARPFRDPHNKRYPIHEWGELERLPVCRALKAPPPPFRWLDRTEQAKLLEVAKTEPCWYPAVLLALRTGVRVGELLGLDWEDIDWERKLATVRRSFVKGVLGTPKNNRVRHVPLTSDALAALLPLRQSTGPVFRRLDGRRRGATPSAKALWRLIKRAGLGQFGWHTLRHTFATSLAMSGTPLRIVQELLGHASIIMTERYAHVSPEAMRTAVDALERTFVSSNKLEGGQPAGNLPEVVEQRDSEDMQRKGKK